MAKTARAPYYIVAAPLIATGAAFAAIGASGQTAFAWTAAGLLIPGVVLLVTGLWRNRGRLNVS
ncbi:hypothetical protein J2W83_000484 [Pseudomonas hunanensis]|uniref:Uncharacterized protein n=1 Tax=Pseudomonas hunanensis TaxID=1247546 RepID=A0ACC6JXF9_9PSED|nr:hypothetical protein [Pseudomonas hunanensis]MDR6710894.1 hypothetical protein [Pseudomonas hunanensis]